MIVNRSDDVWRALFEQTLHGQRAIIRVMSKVNGNRWRNIQGLILHLMRDAEYQEFLVTPGLVLARDTPDMARS